MIYQNYLLFLSIIPATIWISHAIRTEEIVGGRSATEGMFPSVVAIEAKKNYSSFHVVICGGAILTQILILAAAHCFQEDENFNALLTYSIVAGTHDLGSLNHVYIEIELIYLLPYHEYFNDIAVVKLKVELDMIANQNLQKLNLPNDSISLVNGVGRVAGFGLTKTKTYKDSLHRKRRQGTGKPSSLLQYGDFKIASPTICRDRHFFAESEKILCGFMIPVGRRKRAGLCIFDSGSPLIVKENIIVGIVSMGSLECDDTKEPSVFTRVDNYLDFIKGIQNNTPTEETLIYPNPPHMRS